MAELQIVKIPIDKIKIPDIRVTAEFDEETKAYLKSSIEKFGLASPIIVRPLQAGEYELIDGKNRLDELKEAGAKEVDVVIQQIPEKEALKLNVATALAKGFTNPIQVANALKKLKEQGETEESLAEAFGKNVYWIRLYLAIGDLKPKYQEALLRGALSIGVIEKAIALGKDEEIDMALDYAILYKYRIKDMQTYVQGRKKDIEEYEKHREEVRAGETTAPPTDPGTAYLVECSLCHNKVDSRFMRGASICKACLYVVNMVYKNLGNPTEAIPILEKLIGDYVEKKTYERLKAKYEQKPPEIKKEPETPSVPPQTPPTSPPV